MRAINNSRSSRRPFLRTLLAMLAGFATLPAQAQALEKFSFLTSWYAQAEHGGYYQAKATGRYAKAGLDVTLKMGGPQIHGIQLLAAGEVDAVMGYDLQVVQAIERGLPVITVAATFQHDLQGLMTHDDVRSLADLKTKTILVSTSGRTTWWPWMVGKFGLREEQLQVYTFNLQPFFANPNAATSAYPSSEPYQAKLKGMPARFYLLAEAAIRLTDRRSSRRKRCSRPSGKRCKPSSPPRWRDGATTCRTPSPAMRLSRPTIPR